MATSIFEVQVDDASFKKFQADFEKYTVTVQGLPMAWGRIEEAIVEVGKKIDAQTDALSKVPAQTDKAIDKQKKFNTALKETAGTWGTISRWTKMAVSDGTALLGIYGAISNRITGAAVSMLKWGTVGSLGAGLAGAGGLWGISHLASAAGATRRASLGLGLNPGELRAYETNFSTMFDPRSVLGNLSSARNDPDKRWALLSMGLDPNASTGQLASQAPLRAKQIYEEGGQSASYARARGLLEIFTEEDLQRLHNMTVQEIQDAQRSTEQDRRRMAVSDALAQRWQKLSVQFDRASQVIQTVFLDALSPLAPEIEKLSDAFTEAVKTALTMDGMRMAINGLASGIRIAGQYIASQEFLDDIKKFGATVVDVWHAVSRVAAWINGLFGSSNPSTGAYFTPGTARPGDQEYIGWGTAAWHENGRRLGERFGLPSSYQRGTGGQLGGAPGTDVREGVDPTAWLGMARHTGAAGGAPGDRARAASYTGEGAGDFSSIESRRGLPPGFLDRMWFQESRRGTRMGPSSAGAMGHFQFMPPTGEAYGLRRPEDFNDLTRSSEAAGAHMQDLLRQFGGDLAKATAAYNWRPSRVEAAVREHGDRWREHIPRETSEYLTAVVDPILEQMRRQQQAQTAQRPAGTVPAVSLRIENPAGAQVAVTGAAARAQ